MSRFFSSNYEYDAASSSSEEDLLSSSEEDLVSSSSSESELDQESVTPSSTKVRAKVKLM